MIIKSLELSDYRNYESLKIEFDQGTNILWGNNAQGKTNILEAIYCASTTKSHKGSKDREIIRFDHEEAHIRTYLNRDGEEIRVDMHLRKNQSKGIAIDGKKLRKAAELMGICYIVFFSPEDLEIIKKGPMERRKFANMELCQLDPSYLNNLYQYNKIIEQRNKLLKDIHYQPALYDTLYTWDDQLVSYGMKIIQKRRQFSLELNELVGQIHAHLSGNKERLCVFYEPNVTEDEFWERMRENREKDLKLKSTSTGPHRDDFSFIINGIDIRKYGSQGQQRTAALSLKLSEIELMKKSTNQNPILLLDDVLSELDGERQNTLLSYIGDIQTIITCTGLEDFVKNKFPIHRTFHVGNGTAISG
jgi:DNA replication and repair protein RecF